MCSHMLLSSAELSEVHVTFARSSFYLYQIPATAFSVVPFLFCLYIKNKSTSHILIFVASEDTLMTL